MLICSYLIAWQLPLQLRFNVCLEGLETVLGHCSERMICHKSSQPPSGPDTPPRLSLIRMFFFFVFAAQPSLTPRTQNKKKRITEMLHSPEMVFLPRLHPPFATSPGFMNDKTKFQSTPGKAAMTAWSICNRG